MGEVRKGPAKMQSWGKRETRIFMEMSPWYQPWVLASAQEKQIQLSNPSFFPQWPMEEQRQRKWETYLPQTPSGSSPRSHSGSPLHLWWCSRCPSLLSGPGRHGRGCASVLPELSFACRTMETRRAERVWGQHCMCERHSAWGTSPHGRCCSGTGLAL